MDDTIYDITLPVNRNDENSYLVFCFELANKLNLKLPFDINNLAKWTSNVTNDMNIDYSICNFLCYLDYDANKNFIDHSPFSLKSMLINHKIKQIKYLFDQLNYMQLLINCPIHIYDYWLSW